MEQFDDIDILLFEIILKYGEVFEDVNNKSPEYKLHFNKDIMTLNTEYIEVERKGKKSEKLIMLLGVYNEKDETFNWMEPILDINKERITKGNLKPIIKEDYGNMRTIKKLLKPLVKIPHKYKNVIPYLMAIFNPSFNFVRAAAGNYELYALVSLGIKDDFNYDKYVESLSVYRLLANK